MADDIVTRLRLRAAHADDDYLSYAAADEIERLRKDNELLSAVCHDLHHDATCNKSFCRLCGEGIREWEAVRAADDIWLRRS